MTTGNLNGGQVSIASPKLAVVMPIFNAMPYLDAAIESIVQQTHADFELCIYDDHSTDGSYECAQSWAARDPRIRLSRGTFRLGPVGSSNAAMQMTQADLVARMDADDVAHKERLAKQCAIMCAHPDVVLVGSTFRLINGSGELLSPETSDRLLATDFPLRHPTIMVRRSAFVAAGGYRTGTDYFEDNDLYIRMGEQGRCLVIRQPLVDVRMAGQHARLRDERAPVIAQLDRFFRRPAKQSAAQMRCSANTVKAMAQLYVFNQQQPGMVGYMLKHGSFTPPGTGLAVLTYVTLGQLSPRLTLMVMRAIWRVREIQVSRRLKDRTLFPWVPKMEKAEVSGSDTGFGAVAGQGTAMLASAAATGTPPS